MATYSWPGTLPTEVDSSGFSETVGVLVLVSPMDAGPAKMRRRGQKPRKMNVSFVMDDTQISTLETFIQSTLRGTARFDFPHPRTGVTMEVRIVPSGDGEYFTINQFAPFLYNVAMTFEQLP